MKPSKSEQCELVINRSVWCSAIAATVDIYMDGNLFTSSTCKVLTMSCALLIVCLDRSHAVY